MNLNLVHFAPLRVYTFFEFALRLSFDPAQSIDSMDDVPHEKWRDPPTCRGPRKFQMHKMG
jgi:hypothetical protein